jgi:hypothetical protein
MTLLKRLVTSVVLFVILFVVLYFAISIIGGAVAGGMAGVHAGNRQESYELGRVAGEGFVRNNIGLILLGSLLGSAVSSLLLSFSSVFPWCRKPSASTSAFD